MLRLSSIAYPSACERAPAACQATLPVSNDTSLLTDTLPKIRCLRHLQKYVRYAHSENLCSWEVLSQQLSSIIQNCEWVFLCNQKRAALLLGYAGRHAWVVAEWLFWVSLNAPFLATSLVSPKRLTGCLPKIVPLRYTYKNKSMSHGLFFHGKLLQIWKKCSNCAVAKLQIQITNMKD